MRAIIATALLCLAGAGVWALQDEPGDRPERPPRMQMPPMGGSSMVAHKDHLYVFAAGTLYKVDSEKMAVVGECKIVQPPAK